MKLESGGHPALIVQDALVLSYNDRVSAFWLWWKAVLLCPLWAVPIIPLVGCLAAFGGDFLLEAGFALVLLLCFAYLVDDLLKRKIRVDDGVLYFGCKGYELQDLISVSAVHKRDHVFPDILELNFANGQVLELKTARFKAHELNTLLRLIERSQPQCKFDPLLAGALKGRKRLGRRKSWPGGGLEIPYRSSSFLRNLVSAFFGTAEKWTRLGPLVGVAICIPVWSNFLTDAYLLGARIGHMDQSMVPALQTLMMDASQHSFRYLHSVSKVSSQAIGEFLTNPITSLASSVFILIVLYQLLKTFCRPSALLLSPAGLTLHLKVAGSTIPVETLGWDDLTCARLTKPPKDSRSSVIRLHKKDNSSVDLKLSALEPEDRKHILSALEQYAPDCQIDPELGETLLPKQKRSYTELWLQSLSGPRERSGLEPLAPGQFLQAERYEVLRRLGIGGQGMAYLCIDHGRQTAEPSPKVVLKESILPVFADTTVREQAVERFQEEARILGRLTHGGIVKLLDVFIEDHRGYLVLEHVSGRNLRQVVDHDGPLPEQLIRQLAAAMCDILDYLHGNGILHRDFTPDNLMLTDLGELALIDFNVASKMESGATGTIVGKHAYLPPEQFRGKPTQQSDLYAMGATLYFLLTGRDPEPITQLSALSCGSAVSSELDFILSRLTALNCDRRFQSAADVKEALTAGTTFDTDGCTISLAVREAEPAAEGRS